MSEWISVDEIKERSRSKYILVYVEKYEETYAAYYDQLNNEFYCECGKLIENVSHWMPRPKPPTKIEQVCNCKCHLTGERFIKPGTEFYNREWDFYDGDPCCMCDRAENL